MECKLKLEETWSLHFFSLTPNTPHPPPWGEGREAHNFLPIYMQVLPLSFLGLLNGGRGKKIFITVRFRNNFSY